MLDYGIDEDRPSKSRAVDYEKLKQANNPHNKPTGHFTGRCKQCGSSDLWDDNSAYGCNSCGAFWCF